MQRTADSARSSHETGEVFTSERDGYATGSLNQYDHSYHSQATDSASANGVHTPELEDAESGAASFIHNVTWRIPYYSSILHIVCSFILQHTISREAP